MILEKLPFLGLENPRNSKEFSLLHAFVTQTNHFQLTVTINLPNFHATSYIPPALNHSTARFWKTRDHHCDLGTTDIIQTIQS